MMGATITPMSVELPEFEGTDKVADGKPLPWN